jgi:hypothetical protein
VISRVEKTLVQDVEVGKVLAFRVAESEGCVDADDSYVLNVGDR